MIQENDNFRDSLGTVNKEGKRAWVFPKKPSGRYYTWRTWVSYALLVFLILAPFIKINGNQFLLFNVLERRFHIFGFPFWPQDFYLFVLSMIIGVVFLALFTVAFGRIFCGWICPQTIFMEMVFRKIEYRIEGDRGAQMRLDRQPWNAEKIRKRLLKWSVFVLISFGIANVFLAYLIGGDVVLEYIKESPAGHLGTFIPLLIFTGVFYFIFAWFREQVCIIACPYGRLQGVLLDEKSIVVAYDHKRGEGKNGRKKFRKTEDRKALEHGDCIDCLQCVQVCPTGIDIRNGTQLECVNCTACIDACDHIMEKVGYPKGLIRYASEENIRTKTPFRVTARMKGYAAVLFILMGLLTGLLFLRNEVEVTLLRVPGQLFGREGANVISNVYTYKAVNKTTAEIDSVTFRLLSHEGEVKPVSGARFHIPGQGMAEGTLFIKLPQSQLEGDKTRLKLGLYRKDKQIETVTVNFQGPVSYR
ncbi:cytochrome c oxidase accessory protein CcoG [Sinomicrobium weinanense]|uniref:Cytochrome c oxidase accessory protein CcoG n=1 Tax=Sinomicrobium weinanense TaxID=2842200 RepID=A0A926Q486_9FLAO|nr:cytochrome c oxidase accessory protein CcoG [Sinomicrobium weinanense]MBC9798337.1 cytochrome c oxidase accessory protein CcoG [Sinomicrobium weinanense]MBU3121788.1 cytochrome c oxidase accessory protein CcoG [Sinomicrobium weinanense]